MKIKYSLNLKLIKIQEHFSLTVLKWLELYFLQSGSLHYPLCLIKKYFVILRTRGKAAAISFCKERREAIYSWLITMDSLNKESRISSNVKLPKDLRFLKHLKHLEHPLIRLTLSALYISRNLELPPVLNIESIVGEPTNSGSIPRINDYIKDFWYTLGYRHFNGIPQSVYWRKYHLSTKTGPNGQALWSAIADLSSLPNQLKIDLEVIGGKKIFSRMELLSSNLNFLMDYFNVKGGRFRKISAIPSQEGKTREIAILDYWSQSCLQGLHQFLFNALKKIPQDCTFDQGGFKTKVNNFPDNGSLFYSVDLTTATDRFPIKLIASVLKGRLGERYVNSWQNVMVGFPFDSKQGKINYAVGNPMGAYSSWNSFALAHHYVIYYCCRELGIKWSDAPYILLGDDIVIKHDALAKKYMSVMTEIGVSFSLQKSHISPYMFEFAKRIHHCGVEVTPFPISALLNSRKSPSLMMNVCVNEVAKGWSSPLGTPIVLSKLYELLGFNATYVAKKAKIFYISHQIMMGITGRITAADSVRSILVKYYPEKIRMFEMFRMPPDMSDRIFEYWYIAMFRRSLNASVIPKPDEKPLGLLTEQLVIKITGDDRTTEDALSLIQSIPFIQIHGQIEEMYMNVVNGGTEQLNLALKGDWKFVLKALTIPISDKVYVSRNQDIIVHSSFTLAKTLRSLIEKFNSLKDLGPLMRPNFGNK